MSKLLALVIEDNPDIAEVFRVAFQRSHFEVEILRDGNEALSRLGETLPHVIILDLHLPGLSGTEILNRIHADEHLKGVHTIITSADPYLASKYREQADRVLIKPVSYGELRDLAISLSAEMGDE
jgi:DNA-binding response OmpR family regulator